MYICASDASWGATGGDPDFPIVPTGVYSGGFVYQSNIARRGIFAALDVTTNRLRWQQQWSDQCYSGSMTTAGGLVFVGRNDGRLTALDSSNGDKLWEFQTDGGVNSPTISFERNGKQYLVSYAGGTSLAPSKRSDGVWLFSFEGTIESLPRGSANATGQFPFRAGGGPPAPPGGPFAGESVHVPNPADGGVTYATACVTCHGKDGQGGTHGGIALTNALTIGSIITVVTNGRNDMPAFGAAMSQADLQDLAAYLLGDLLAE
jgi:mono/diheme cytochrome c family protein